MDQHDRDSGFQASSILKELVSTPKMPKASTSKVRLVLVNLLVLAALYGVIEFSYSSYCYILKDSSPTTFWLFEHPGETIRFDPDRGYFLSRTPSRFARITYGQVEWVGCLRGNAQGFADRDDFTVQRLTGNQRRVAVLGDSFTSAQYIPLNWPDRVEALTGRGSDGAPVLLNFAVDGGGLANWATIFRNIVVKERYELDGLIIAVAWDDLDRKFTLFDQTDSKTISFARTSSWDTNSQPRTMQEALALLKNHASAITTSSYLLSSAEFDAALSGQWKPRQWHFRVSQSLKGMVRPLLQRFRTSKQPTSGFEPGQLALMREIRRLAGEASLPIAVAYIPSRQELLDPADIANLERTRQFSEILGAKFIDGREAFRGLSVEQIKNDWFLHDGHWNQPGSDRFAEFMVAQIPTWMEARTARTARMSVH